MPVLVFVGFWMAGKRHAKVFTLRYSGLTAVWCFDRLGWRIRSFDQDGMVMG